MEGWVTRNTSEQLNNLLEEYLYLVYTTDYPSKEDYHPVILTASYADSAIDFHVPF